MKIKHSKFSFKRPNHKKIIITSLLLVLISTYATGLFLYSGSEISKYNQKIAEINKHIQETSTKSYLEAKKKQPVYIELPGAKSIRAIVDDYTKESSIWHLVNKTNSLSMDYTPDGLKIPNVATRTDKSDLERSVRSDIETPLVNIFSDANKAGYQLLIGSGYRSAAQQKIYFDSLAASVGEAAANQSIAYPGQSEHQTGLAVDISTISRNCYLEQCFDTTSDGMWLANNSYKYGFILRYPKDKVSVTKYSYEPWHFRYVGIDLATALHESGLTLDEAYPYILTALETLKSNGAI